MTCHANYVYKKTFIKTQNTLNKANNVVKDEKKEEMGIIDTFITSLKRENFSDDSSIDNIRDALEAREQERESEDEIILGIEPEEESTEDTILARIRIEGAPPSFSDERLDAALEGDKVKKIAKLALRLA